jgi:hypothetical protein
LATEDSNVRTLLTNFSEFKDYYFVDLGVINKWTMFTGKIILILVNFYLMVVVYHIARRNNQYRKILIRVLLIYIPLKGLDFYRVAFEMTNASWYKLIMVSFIAIGIFIIPILLFYASKSAKKLMIEDKALREQLIYEIKNKSAN